MDSVQLAWAVILATVAGPVAAVIITLWFQGRSEYKRAQMSVYVTMMRTRRHTLSADFVGSFNLVPVYFRKYKNIMDRYLAVISAATDSAWHDASTRPQAHERINSAIAYLLSDMSKQVGAPVDQLVILQGAYAPQQWLDDDMEQRHLRHLLFGLLTGESPLTVRFAPEAETQRAPDQDKLGDHLLAWADRPIERR